MVYDFYCILNHFKYLFKNEYIIYNVYGTWLNMQNNIYYYFLSFFVIFKETIEKIEKSVAY